MNSKETVPIRYYMIDLRAQLNYRLPVIKWGTMGDQTLKNGRTCFDTKYNILYLYGICHIRDIMWGTCRRRYYLCAVQTRGPRPHSRGLQCWLYTRKACPGRKLLELVPCSMHCKINHTNIMRYYKNRQKMKKKKKKITRDLVRGVHIIIMCSVYIYIIYVGILRYIYIYIYIWASAMKHIYKSLLDRVVLNTRHLFTTWIIRIYTYRHLYIHMFTPDVVAFLHFIRERRFKNIEGKKKRGRWKIINIHNIASYIPYAMCLHRNRVYVSRSPS